MPKRPGRKSAAQTPAPRSERIYGSKKNKPGSASGQSEAKISLSPQIKKALKKKADEFNEKHPTKRVRVATLEKVFRRGAGAYSKSHRPTITGNVPNTRSAWSFARVNKFLKKKSGQKVKAAYVQDDDLLMDGGEVMAKGGQVKKLAAGYYEGIYNGVKFTITHQDENAYGGKPMWYFQINDGPVDDLFSTKAQAIQAAKQVIDENFAKGGEVKFNDKELLAKYNRGESIGFTAVAHLKAKGLIPRADGTKRKSEKYLVDGGEIENYLKNVRIEPSDSGRLYRANFGESGGISWEITESYFDKDASNYGKDPNNPNAVIVQSIDSSRIGSKGEGAKAIASLFLRYTNLKEILYDDYSEGFWERIGGKVDVLKREDFFKYFNSKFNSELYNDGGLIAPNGKPSNLTPEQYNLVRTPEFKAWFGDWENDPKNASKVVDDNGEPLVCYHGTEMTFSVFDKSSIGSASGEPNQGNGFYFTSDYLNAKSYADYYSNTSGGEFPSIVLACFLKANNPLVKSSVSRSSDILNDVYYASQNGYDAFIVSKVRESGEYTSVEGANQIVVFEPEQIKLADGTNTSFDGSNPDIRYNDGGVVFVRNKNYDNSHTIRRLPYRGVSAFAVATDDFEKFKQYAEKEEGVDPSNWQVYDMDDFDNYQVCAMKMSETNDYVMGWSDDKPKLEPFDAQEHTMYIDEDGNLDYDDAHEIIILPTKTMDRGGMTAIFVNNMLESAKDIDNIIEYALENDIKPTDPEFNTKVNPDGKYSAFEIRLAKRELKKYSHGGELPMQITCKKCGWSWNTADSQPQDATTCHKCGFDNVSEDIISMNAPTYLRSLEFAREDAKEDVDLHKVTENAVALSKEHPIRMKEYDELVKLENGGVDEYADGGQFFSYEPKEYDIQEFICKEQDLADVLSNNGDMTRLGKIRICKAKINLAEDKLKNATSDREVEAWYMSTCIWTDCMNGLKSNYKSGGKVGGCGCYKDGGLAYGNSHDKGGMPLTVKSTGQNIEIEGGEGVVNKRSMQMNKTVEFQGKKLTPCEVVSKINEMGGGVKFKCDDVKKIIAEDGHFD